MADPRKLKVVVMGAGATGKSAVIIRFIANEFRTEYNATIEDSYSSLLSVDGNDYEIDVLDTAGQEQFAALQDHWIREGEIFILMYAINLQRTMKHSEDFHRKILRIKEENDHYSVVLVGNKSDLPYDQREITYDEGKQLADSWGCPFIETSAKNGINVVLAFESAIRKYVSSNGGNNHSLERNLLINSRKKCSCSCNYNCDFIKAICGKKDKSQHPEDEEFEAKDEYNTDDREQIKFFKVNTLPPDEIPAPILALKNFKIQRRFHFGRFCVALLCGLVLPFVIIIQTISFLCYGRLTESCYTKLYPKYYQYDDIHASLSLDFIGIVVGRKPNQDPECVKDRQWFLLQTPLQLMQRIVIMIFVCIVFGICCYNITQMNNYKDLNVSLMETAGPFLLFWILWLLLSVWIGYELKLKPKLPSLSRLRSIWLFFGETFSHRSSAYKFLRAYAMSRDNKWRLSSIRLLMVVVLGALYASVPGITRSTIGDSTDGLEQKRFLTQNGWYVQVGALLVNFLLISSFVYAIEVQYSKHFDNYREWMYDLTMLLNKTDSDDQNKNEHYIPEKGRHFSKQLFLSLTRRSNALGWLEIRSFLAVEGQILFGEQELPTLWILLLTISLTLFILYRVYFLSGHPMESALFNGSVVLGIVCLLSLTRIAITGYQFETLQSIQERLLGEQKFFMRCNKKYSTTNKLSQNIGSIVANHSAIVVEEEKEEKQSLFVGGDTDKTGDVEMVAMTNNTLRNRNENNNKLQSEKDYLLQVREEINGINWYSHNVGFIEDMIFIVNRKDIYPKLFKVKLNSVLAKAIAGIVLSGIVTAFKLFVD